MTGDWGIDYEALTQQALRGVLRTVLSKVARSGLPGEHHFYIAFDTRYPGVSLSRRLREKYPEEMTIVMQHRFWDLSVSDDVFEVKLTFDGIPERLVVPLAAVRVFFDPSVRYSVQLDDPTSFDQIQDSDSAGRRSSRSKAPRRPIPSVDGSSTSENTTNTSQAAPGSEAASPPATLTTRAKSDRESTPMRRPQKTVEPVNHITLETESKSADQASVSGAKIFSLDAFRKK